MAEYWQNADWRESEHPRDENGKFVEKGVSRDALTSSEWRQYYDKFGEIRLGYHVTRLNGGKYAFVIGNKLIISAGTYEQPICVIVQTFDNEQIALDMLELIGDIYE